METPKVKNDEKAIIAFKSYYVVWKRLSLQNISQARPSLNRTMQYGNTTDLGRNQKYYLV